MSSTSAAGRSDDILDDVVEALSELSTSYFKAGDLDVEASNTSVGMALSLLARDDPRVSEYDVDVELWSERSGPNTYRLVVGGESA